MMRFFLAAWLFFAVTSPPCLASPNAATPASVAAVPLLADLDMDWQWDWDSFKRFWSRQFRKSTGVVGLVLLIVGGGVVVVMMSSKPKA